MAQYFINDYLDCASKLQSIANVLSLVHYKVNHRHGQPKIEKALNNGLHTQFANHELRRGPRPLRRNNAIHE